MAKSTNWKLKPRFKIKRNIIDKIKERSFVQKDNSNYLYWKDQQLGYDIKPNIFISAGQFVK